MDLIRALIRLYTWKGLLEVEIDMFVVLVERQLEPMDMVDH